MKKITAKDEGTLGVITALLVLFTAMADPLMSVMVAIGAILLFSIYKFTQK